MVDMGCAWLIGLCEADMGCAWLKDDALTPTSLAAKTSSFLVF
jgi:hypothetical protein